MISRLPYILSVISLLVMPICSFAEQDYLAREWLRTGSKVVKAAGDFQVVSNLTVSGSFIFVDTNTIPVYLEVYRGGVLSDATRLLGSNTIQVMVTAATNWLAGDCDAAGTAAAAVAAHNINASAHATEFAAKVEFTDLFAGVATTGLITSTAGDAAKYLLGDGTWGSPAGSDAIFVGAGTTGLITSTAGDAAKYLLGDGTWGTPVGAGDFLADGSVPMTGPINFAETTEDNFGLESVTYAVTGQVNSVWLGYAALQASPGDANNAMG